MSYQVTFKHKRGYLHAVVTGQNTRENAVRYLEEIRDECAVRGYERVLIEEQLQGPRLPLKDVLDVLASALVGAKGPLPTILYVDINAVGTTMRVAESIAVSRGVNVWVFGTVAEAERWLDVYYEPGAESGIA